VKAAFTTTCPVCGIPVRLSPSELLLERSSDTAAPTYQFGCSGCGLLVSRYASQSQVSRLIDSGAVAVDTSGSGACHDQAPISHAEVLDFVTFLSAEDFLAAHAELRGR